MAKCINCQSENIYATDEPEEPFRCFDCGWWGKTENLVENPPEDDEENYREGRVPKKLTDEEDD